MKILAPLAEEGKINSEASIRDSQSTIINAPIQEVWEILADIENWPTWNPDIKSVTCETFEVGESFKWNLQGSHITSTIRKIQQPEILSWTGTAMGIKAIHVWHLDESDGQTIVSTHESVQGLLTIFMGHQKLHNTLLNWLSRLKQKAERK